jgi:hypothetical protein
LLPVAWGPASLGFTLLGAGGALTALQAPARWGSISAALAAMTLCVASVPLLGYLYGEASLYSRPASTGIAAQTVVSLLVLSLAMLVTVRARDALQVLRASSGAGLLARTVLPAVVVVPIVLGWLRVRAKQAGWFGPDIATTLFVLSVIIWSALVLWWGVQAVDARERAMAVLGERQRLAEVALANTRDQLTVVDRDWRYVYVRQLVTLHGGEVQAASAGPGQGSRFTVRLPIAVRAPEPEAALQPSA